MTLINIHKTHNIIEDLRLDLNVLYDDFDIFVYFSWFSIHCANKKNNSKNQVIERRYFALQLAKKILKDTIIG